MKPLEACPQLEELEELVAGRLADDRSTRLHTHVTDCPVCSRHVEELRADLDLGSRLRRALGGVHEAAPPTIEGFEIVREVGRGGMGIVYEAFQAAPRRRVALKVVRGARFVDAQTLRLFAREIEVLARLEHPGIAALFAAGETGGEHWFAMEYVDGRPLVQHAGGLPVSEKLERFLQLCDAIAHAHAHGVVHRDIKPSNVLVGEGGRVQVLDFGLAKITDTDVSIVTEPGHIRGTLAYMSPEQARGDPAAIGLGSDVYSLGVVLFELLCDALPIDTSGVAIHEAARRVIEEAPRKPSAIVPGLPGDLETIVLKALEKDASRRYASVEALAEDVRRFLANDVILARPPNAAYELRKLVARHQAAFATLALIVAGAIGVALWTSILYSREAELVVEQERLSRELGDALDSERQARGAAETAATSAREQSQLAEKRLKIAAVESQSKKEGLDFLVGLFSEAGSREGRTGRMSAAELLKRGIARLKDRRDSSPYVRITLLQSVGSAAYRVGLFDDASKLLEEGIALAREHASGETILGAMLVELGLLRRTQGRAREAVELLREGADVYVAKEGADAPNALQARTNLAQGYRDAGDPARAVASAQELLALTPARPEVRDRRLNLRTLLGQAHYDLRDFDAARADLETGLSEYDAPGPNVYLASAHNTLGMVLLAQSRLEAARARFQEALDMRLAVLDPDHEHVATSYNNLAAVAHELEDFAGAEQYLKKAWEIQVKRFGPNSIVTSLSDANRAENFIQAGDFDAAEPLAAHALEVRRAALGADHPKVAGARLLLAKVALHRAEYAQAEAALRDVLRVYEAKLGAQHPDTLQARLRLAECLAATDRKTEARSLAEQIVVDARLAKGMSRRDLAEIERFARGLSDPGDGRIDASPR